MAACKCNETGWTDLTKDTRRQLEQSQKQLDHIQARFSGQAKSKEASALREDAFQLHEARKAYLRLSMDFSVIAPQLRMTLDKTLVKVFSDQWREMRSPQDSFNGVYGRWGNDIERVRGWSQDMEASENTFKKELFSARKQIEESAEAVMRPSRELEEYSSTATFPSLANLQAPTESGSMKAEKQGWLTLRTVTGKPSRTVWLRRWFFVKNGIFGWLVQGSRSGGVEESERIGVLLCSVRASVTEDRRFCFEVKTKDRTIIVQAETQSELIEWVAAFEIAKQKALEDPSSTDSPGLDGSRGQDAAFAILPPSAPEFAASAADSGVQSQGDEGSGNGPERANTLPVPGIDSSPNLAMRNSFDVSGSRRSAAEGDSGRDHASRIIQKLDLHRKSTASAQTTGPFAASSSASAGIGGIASLIAASHIVMPIGPGVPPPAPEVPTVRPATSSSAHDLPYSTLAPNTLANPPAPTNLSSTAIIINGEKGIGMGRADATGGMPGGLMANVWGTTNWGYLNRLERGELKTPTESGRKVSAPPSPRNRPSPSPPKRLFSGAEGTSDALASSVPATPESSPSHRKTVSMDDKEGSTPKASSIQQDYPNYYPLQLKTQDAQFRLLFPNVRREERVVLVFRATWNLNDQQDFPGRVYATAKEMFFYSHYLGLVLISGISLTSIVEVTAAPGRDSDFIFLHLKENQMGFKRITIKTFLEPLKLLQKRLNFLVNNGNSDAPLDLETVMKTLIKLEQDDPTNSPSLQSWDEMSSSAHYEDGFSMKRNASQRNQPDLRASVLVDSLHKGNNLGDNKDVTKFKLPKQPVIYAPANMDTAVVVKEFDISPKALFHVMFGDKSAVWQLLYHEREARHIKQSSWAQPEEGHLRREFNYEIAYSNIFGQQRQITVVDYQMVDVLNDHLCYVVTDRKTPFYLPSHTSFLMLSKFIITHVAKSKCKLAIYTKVDWLRRSGLLGRLITNRALADLESDAKDLSDVIGEQVRKLGAHSRTKKAIQIFGQVGQQTQVSEFSGSDAPSGIRTRRSLKRRTMPGLLFEAAVSLITNVVMSLLTWALALVKWVWKTCDANSVLLAVLAVSVFTNMFFTTWSTRDWWRERNAGKFMARLGVGPELSMSKGIYMHDLDDAVGYVDSMVVEVPATNRCRQTFHDLTASTSLSATPSKSSSTRTAKRLQRTRQNLGSYRHDLMVAMRVVNSIEREVVQAEYEDWLMMENRRCKQLEDAIGANKTELQEGRLAEVKRWQGEYCDSCGIEERRVLGQEHVVRV